MTNRFISCSSSLVLGAHAADEVDDQDDEDDESKAAPAECRSAKVEASSAE